MILSNVRTDIDLPNFKFSVARLSRLPPLPVTASSGDTRQSGSLGYVLEEDGHVLELADKNVLFVLVEIYMQKFMLE